VSIEGTGKEARGSGTASATVQAQLHDEGEQTRVTVHTKLNVTGRPAQFGRNILSEVGGKLISRFAGNLEKEITREPAAAEAEAPKPEVAPAEPVAGEDSKPQVTPEPRPAPAPQAPERAAARAADDEAIDLLEFAGPSIAKRVFPVVAGLVAVWTFRRIVRRARRR
jgi:hypothetical protein